MYQSQIPWPVSSLRAVVILLISIIADVINAADLQQLEAKLKPLLSAYQGQVSLAMKHIELGERFDFRATEPMPTASLIKLPVMIEAYRQAHEGKLDLNQLVTLREEDKVPGSGILTPHFSAGMSLSIRDAIRLMIAYSDNTATNLVVEKIGLPATADTMSKMGLPNTKLHAKVFRGDTSIFPERSQRFGLGSTTASEMISILEMLAKRELVSVESSDRMREHLLSCQDKEKFSAGLPAHVKVAQKGGAVAAVRTDAGLIFTEKGTIALCVLTNQNKDQRWTADNSGNVLCAQIARLVYEHYNQEEPVDTTDPQTIQLGSTGALVEILQRSLNQRLRPAPQLTVDGDFGTTTESVVKRFQKERSLPVTGIVNNETWQALTPLLLIDPPVPEPEVVNNEQLSRKPADPVSGPPLVSAKAWTIGDMENDTVWEHFNGDTPVPIASTTKVMTAHIVSTFIYDNPAVLDEIVLFSQRADRTIGSTAGIRAGEQITVRELLYGLLLPSGNDAAVALAEHFGDRCGASQSDPESKDPLTKFVARMNDEAAKLGMKNSHFANPHGLPDEAHLSTANDLLKLARVAAKHRQIKECANCRQHGCRLLGPGGYQRNILWKNTNRLLEIEGYEGLKTGTTTPAGSCLISLAEHQNRRVCVVVLGASSDENRYLDTRNLFKWAREQIDRKLVP